MLHSVSQLAYKTHTGVEIGANCLLLIMLFVGFFFKIEKFLKNPSIHIYLEDGTDNAEFAELCRSNGITT